ncbi:glycosyl transferase group 1 [Methanobacterium lacus]|uniref:Glycosyl transferase group 1 n=1 Tax=Methanobacterium lacus (strain AL-21) TaxID=877455 RepID=F0TC69_METLA|nr:glycosyltransferase family 1 protein [Methanobacterium lacus]ADZ09220.1 glycosyl transferase group 1 [Methanobacterium lacus]
MEIDYINGVESSKIFGRSKYQMEIFGRINDVNLNIIEYKPLADILKKRLNMTPERSGAVTDNFQGGEPGRVSSFLFKTAFRMMDRMDQYRYIHEIKGKLKEENIKHITTQELAYVLKSLENYKTVLTCFDLIPWVYDNDRSYIWKENMKWMPTADRIITISEFSKNEILKYLDYPEEKIDIVYPAVDHRLYQPIKSKEILKQFNISDRDKVVLYVGSETPRQNVPDLIRAFNKLKKVMPNVKLLKIGESQSNDARVELLKLIKQQDLVDDVIFAGYVAEPEMPEWYSAADLLVYPCEYAGFGLPPLEAMACGTPVITSNTTSLPEVVGEAGIMLDPHDNEKLSKEMYRVLNDEKLADNLIQMGLERAKLFDWDESAQQTMEVYRSMEKGR